MLGMSVESLVALFGDMCDEDVPLEDLMYPEDQSGRRAVLLRHMLEKAKSVERAAELVMGIMEKNQHRMKLDENGKLVIVGHLAYYRIDMFAFLKKFVNPFTYTSFDVVEVHPKSGLVPKPETACVQVRDQDDMPAYDLFAGYILGLLNDNVTWLTESLEPLRNTLIRIYGVTPSPLTESLAAHFGAKVGGEFDFSDDSFTFEGTNGWKWKLGFGHPLTRGFSIAYQKPRQTWWNPMFDDHLQETTGHYSLCGFFEVVEHLAASPAILKTANDWQTDPIFVRKVALDYPPLAKLLMETVLDAEEYDPYEIYTFYDERVNEDEARTIVELDEQVRRRAHA